VGADGTVALVALDLVDAALGDEVLVHGGVAIARTPPAEAAPRGSPASTATASSGARSRRRSRPPSIQGATTS